jgi:hypothetical protein
MESDASMLGVLSAGSFFLLIISLPPTGIGIVFPRGFCVVISLLAEILLIHNSILANDECYTTDGSAPTIASPPLQ